MLDIEFDGIIFEEGETYISYSPKLDVSSCGNTVDEARKLIYFVHCCGFPIRHILSIAVITSRNIVCVPL